MDFSGCMWFFCIWCPKSLTDLSGAALRFSFLRIFEYGSSVCNIVSLVESWIKTSSRYVIILLRSSCLKILLLKDENAAGKKPLKYQQAMTKILGRCDGLSGLIWFNAITMSTIEKIGRLMRVSIIWIGSIGQLHFVSSTIVFKWRASRTILSDSSDLSIITGLIYVFHVVRESVFTDEKISTFVRMSSRCFIRSCSCIRVAHCFLYTAAALRCSVNSTLISLHQIYIWRNIVYIVLKLC